MKNSKNGCEGVLLRFVNMENQKNDVDIFFLYIPRNTWKIDIHHEK